MKPMSNNAVLTVGMILLAATSFALGWQIKGEVDRSFVSDQQDIVRKHQMICADIRRKYELAGQWLDKPEHVATAKTLIVSFGPLKLICDSTVP